MHVVWHGEDPKIMIGVQNLFSLMNLTREELDFVYNALLGASVRWGWSGVNKWHELAITIKEQLSFLIPGDPVEKPEDLLWADEILCNACDCKNVRTKVELRPNDYGWWETYHDGNKFPLTICNPSGEWEFCDDFDPSKIRILSRRDKPLEIPVEPNEEPIRPGDIVEIVSLSPHPITSSVFKLGSRWPVLTTQKGWVSIIGTDGHIWNLPCNSVELYRWGE